MIISCCSTNSSSEFSPGWSFGDISYLCTKTVQGIGILTLQVGVAQMLHRYYIEQKCLKYGALVYITYSLCVWSVMLYIDSTAAPY